MSDLVSPRETAILAALTIHATAQIMDAGLGHWAADQARKKDAVQQKL